MCVFSSCLCCYQSLPVSSWGDEIYAAVHSGVWNPFLPVDVDLLLQVCLVLVINEFHDGLPARSCQRLRIEGNGKNGRRRQMDGSKMKGGSTA